MMDKSYSLDTSRSPSKTRGHADADNQPQRSISFDSRFTSDDKKDETSPSRSPSTFRPREVETPHGPVRRDTVQSLRHLAGTSTPPVQGEEEPVWPTDWRAYACLFGGFLLMFNSWGLVNTYGTYSSYYMQTLLPGQDILLLNLVGSTQSFVVLALSAVVGRFLDAGNHRTLIITGTVLVSLGWFTLSYANGGGGYREGNYGLIWLTQGFVTGLGMACFFVSSSQVVATWFKARKSFAIGVVASGASISGLLYPMMTRYLIEDVGFNAADRWVSLVIFLTSCIAVVVARPNPKHIYRKPETFMRLSVFIDTHAFQNRAFAWLVASIAFLFFGFYAVFFNLEEWAVSEGFGYRQAQQSGLNAGLPAEKPHGTMHTFWLLAIMNATSTVGRLSSGYLSDHFGALNVHCVVTTVAALLCCTLWVFAKTLSTAIAFVVIFGAFSGAVIGLPPASCAYVLGKDPKEQAKLGQWTGMMYSAAAIWALTGPVIAGHLITEFSSFLTVQLWSGACMLLSAACMACGIWCRRRTRLQEMRTKFTESSGSSSVDNEKKSTIRREVV